MFLSVEWAKRWLPAVFLLLSLVLPWWTMVDLYSKSSFARMRGWAETSYYRPFESFTSSYLWADQLDFSFRPSYLEIWYFVEFFHIPFLFFISALVLAGGLFGLSNERRARTVGGLLGIGSVIFYSIWRFAYPPINWVRNIYFGIGEYQVGFGFPFEVGAVWFLSVGFYLATFGSLMLLFLSIRTPIETSEGPIFLKKEFISSSIRLTKSRIPTIFLLVSLFLPWWALVYVKTQRWSSLIGRYLFQGDLSFPWGELVKVHIGSAGLHMGWAVEFSLIPYFGFASALVVVAAYFGLFSKDRTRILGGLLGIMSIISYSILILPRSIASVLYLQEFGSPFFGMYQLTRVAGMDRLIWFVSHGFYLAIIGSLMLLSPLFRTLVERLRKRL